MTIYDQQEKIVEKKFYHAEWKLTDLLKARNDGLITDEGEAWKYRYSHMDGTGGKYDLLFRREPAAIEAPAQEPVAWRVRVRSDDAEEWSLLPAGGGADYSDRKGYECQPLYTTPSDHIALVAAAYRDAAEAIDADGECVRAIGLSKHILARTPADAQAALTAIERAAYERGVRDAADAVPVDQYHESWMARMLVCARVRILALLTQEGR